MHLSSLVFLTTKRRFADSSKNVVCCSVAFSNSAFSPESLSVKETLSESTSLDNELLKSKVWYLGDYEEMNVTVLVPITFISKAFC